MTDYANAYARRLGYKDTASLIEEHKTYCGDVQVLERMLLVGIMSVFSVIDEENATGE